MMRTTFNLMNLSILGLLLCGAYIMSIPSVYAAPQPGQDRPTSIERAKQDLIEAAEDRMRRAAGVAGFSIADFSILATDDGALFVNGVVPEMEHYDDMDFQRGVTIGFLYISLPPRSRILEPAGAGGLLSGQVYQVQAQVSPRTGEWSLIFIDEEGTPVGANFFDSTSPPFQRIGIDISFEKNGKKRTLCGSWHGVLVCIHACISWTKD